MEQYEEYKRKIPSCKARRLVDGELIICEGKLTEEIRVENGADVLVEYCAVCGARPKLQSVPMDSNVVRQRALSDEVFQTPMQYLL